jgi:DNA repair photolyase
MSGPRRVIELIASKPAAEALKGRGTAWALPHRFSTQRPEDFDDGWGTLQQAAAEEVMAPQTQVVEEQVRSILSPNDSPDIGFDLSINPYRGCEHGCIYCYARPTHSYLNLSPGIDFETRIVAKVNAAERLREAFARKGYQPKMLNVGSVTDAYQPVERRLRITRAVVEVLAEHRHAFSVITKSSLVERDLDLIVPMAQQQLVAAYVSVTTLDAELARVLEPRAVSPARRLPWEVSPLFQQWLEQHFPERTARIMARVREMRGGRDNDARFGSRMTGQGVWAQLLRQRFDKACARLGLNRERIELDLSRFRPPAAAEDAAQASLF